MAETTTVYASIGNSDDRLTQAQWSEFHATFAMTIRDYATTVHGSWLSNPADPWQNACMAFDVHLNDAGDLQRELAIIAGRFNQDSIAWAAVGDTEFIGTNRARADT
jgi:hypothetical protein